MKDKYLDKLSQSKFYRGGYITLNQHATGMVIESVTKIKFGFLYSRLLIYFHDNGVLDRFGIEVPNNIITELKYYFDNNSPFNYQEIDEVVTRLENYLGKHFRAIYVYPVGCERQRLLQSFYRNIEIESLNLFFDIK